MKHPWLVSAAVALLAIGWSVALVVGTFTAHMAAHVAAVALAAPLLALGLWARPRMLGTPLAALVACAVELVVVWGWHAPWAHAAARAEPVVFVLEQLTFLAAGYAVWASAIPRTDDAAGRGTALAGVGALLMTSMHMSLLGGLLAVSSRPFYHGSGAQALWDQQLGGVLMLAVGGLVYLAGALVLLGRALGRQLSWEESP